MAESNGRDIVVVGGSTGAIDAMGQVLSDLDSELPAALFAVIHGGADSPAYLADILSKRGRLKVRYAADGDPIEVGTLLVAPPDRHLFVKAGEVRVVRGPKENNFRPAVDPLFRTAANSYGRRVIGVILSGGMDDGVHGLMQIKRHGGTAIAQSPDDAREPSMPRAAIERVGVEHVARAEEIGGLLNRLVGENSVGELSPVRDQADVAEGLVSGMRVPGAQPPSPFICPGCGGALWQIEEGGLLRYRCHIGHGFTADALAALQDHEIEQSLWVAIRQMEEQAELQKRLADRAVNAHQSLRDRFLANAREHQQSADLLRSLVTGHMPAGTEDVVSPPLQHEYRASVNESHRLT